jgi:hypothetical protein
MITNADAGCAGLIARCPISIKQIVAGEVDSRYARIAAERDAAPRASECRPKIDEAIELCSFWWRLSYLQSLLPPEADGGLSGTGNS